MHWGLFIYETTVHNLGSPRNFPEHHGKPAARYFQSMCLHWCCVVYRKTEEKYLANFWPKYYAVWFQQQCDWRGNVLVYPRTGPLPGIHRIQRRNSADTRQDSKRFQHAPALTILHQLKSFLDLISSNSYQIFPLFWHRYILCYRKTNPGLGSHPTKSNSLSKATAHFSLSSYSSLWSKRLTAGRRRISLWSWSKNVASYARWIWKANHLPIAITFTRWTPILTLGQGSPNYHPCNYHTPSVFTWSSLCSVVGPQATNFFTCLR